jgi:hypothetical protein
MLTKTYGALFASLITAATLVSATPSIARPSGAAAHGSAVGAAASPHVRGPIAPAARFRGARRNAFTYWPGGGGFFYEPYQNEPYVETSQPPAPSNDVRYTYTYDVPWDWAHRFPPNVVPSDRPYVPGCPSETVTVPGRGGEHTVNIMRCY